LNENTHADMGAEPNLQASSEYKPMLSPNWVETWSSEEVHNLQQTDKTISYIIQLKAERNEPPDKEVSIKADGELKALLNQWEKLEVHGNLLYRSFVSSDPNMDDFMQLVVPSTLRKEILFMLHSHKSAGHLGITKTLGKLRQRFYWPGYKADVERWCKHCKVCETINSSLNPKKAPLQQKPVHRRMDRIACDIMGPVEISENGNRYILVVCDYVSKFTEAYPLADITAQTVADVLSTQWICRYGCPVVVHSDQGRNFESELFKAMCALWDIHKTRTSRYRPCSDGLVERQNRTIKKLLRAFTEENPKTWEDHLPYVMMAYRATDQSSTNASPNLLMFGEENRLPVDLMYADCSLEQEVPVCPQEYIEWVREASRSAFTRAHEHLKKSAQRQKRLYDRNTHLREFKVGDWVWVLHPPSEQKKFGRGWLGPSLVIKRLGKVNYVVQSSQMARKITLHVDHMKVYLHDDVPESWVEKAGTRKDVGVQVNPL
jgi:ribosomal protein L21E